MSARKATQNQNKSSLSLQCRYSVKYDSMEHVTSIYNITTSAYMHLEISASSVPSKQVICTKYTVRLVKYEIIEEYN